MIKTSKEVAGMTQGSNGIMTEALDTGKGVRTWYPNDTRTEYTDVAPTAKVTPFTETAGVISSKDDSAGFKNDSSALDAIVNGQGVALNDAQILALEKLGYREGDVVPNKGRLLPDGTFDTSVLGKVNGDSSGGKSVTGVEKPVGEGGETTEGSGDPIYDKMKKWQEEQSLKFDAEQEEKKKAYEAMYQTSLASIDASAQATINNINSTYDQRITEQKRINQLRVDRMKAYGLGSANAMANPIEYTDSVSAREQEGADKVKELDSQRNNLIAQAKSARDQGASKLLREKLADLDNIDEQIRTQLSKVSEEADKQYKLLRDIRKEEETKHKDAIAKMVERLTQLAPKYADEYDKMDNVAKDAFIEQIVKETGLDYAQVFATLNKGVSEAQKLKTTEEKEALSLDKAKNDLAISKNNLAKSQKELVEGKKTDAQNEEDAMKSALPRTFTSEADATKQRKEYVRQFGKKGAEYWDSVFYSADSKVDKGEYNYDIASVPKTPEEAIKADGRTYKEIMATKLPAGQVMVFDKESGQIGAVPKDEADSPNYIRM